MMPYSSRLKSFGWGNDYFITIDLSGGLFFRIAGYGLWFATYRCHPPLFTERNGLETVWKWGRLGRWRMLKP